MKVAYLCDAKVLTCNSLGSVTFYICMSKIYRCKSIENKGNGYGFTPMWVSVPAKGGP